MKKPEKKSESVVQSVEVVRAKSFDNGGVVFDVIINGVSIYNCRVVEGKNGDFISFPARKGSDGNYYSHAYIKLTEDDTKKIIGQVEKALEE
mgnify:CR=1 FL=1